MEPWDQTNDFPLRLATLPKTNIAPENGWLEDEISYWEGIFSGDMLVSRRVYYIFLHLVDFNPKYRQILIYQSDASL